MKPNLDREQGAGCGRCRDARLRKDLGFQGDLAVIWGWEKVEEIDPL